VTGKCAAPAQYNSGTAQRYGGAGFYCCFFIAAAPEAGFDAALTGMG
jgi:hypothetical protein